MTLTSRERVRLALGHREPDRVPVDLGGALMSGMHVSTVYAVRQALGLDPPGTPVKVVEPYQMLGEIKPDLQDAVHADVVGIIGRRTFFGFANEGWKPWTLFDDTPVLVPEGFNTAPEPSGDVLLYPQGDRTAPASGRMPKDGFYFDAIIRQPPVDDATLSVEDNLEEFGSIADADLEHYQREVKAARANTDKAIFLSYGGLSVGDIAIVPGVGLKHPKGIRDIEEWYLSAVTRPAHIYKIFERQCEIGLKNLARIYEAVGDDVDILFISGTDFGAQGGTLINPRIYRELYQPFHRRVNEWVHRHTPWKTLIHSCGSVRALLNDFIVAGFDILNPVQCSAAGMDPRELKKEFGAQLVFWGGGADTQRTLPFGTPEEVRREVCERIQVFAPGGGFVFNPIHNVQAGTPVENLLAMYDALQEYGRYPIS